MNAEDGRVSLLRRSAKESFVEGVPGESAPLVGPTKPKVHDETADRLLGAVVELCRRDD